jgi:hypothetical protein
MLLNSCNKNAENNSRCQKKEDGIVYTTFGESLGGVSLGIKVYYNSVKDHKNECEIGLANSVDKVKFNKILSSLETISGFHDSTTETTAALTIYRIGGLHEDSSVSSKNMVGISRYYQKNNKLFHQFFYKDSIHHSFLELQDLTCEVDGVIFNYMHQIARNVLNLPMTATAIFLKTEEAKGIYKSLKNPQNDLKWKLRLYIQKMTLKKLKLLQTSNVVNNAGYGETCGGPCEDNDDKVCRNGDASTGGGGNLYSEAECGPDSKGQCSLAYVNNALFVNGVDNIVLDDGTSEPLDSCINLDNFRRFRDNVLSNSTVGMKYVNYYYMLSNTLISVIDLQTAIQTAKVSFDVNNAVNMIMDNTANPNTVLFTSGFKNEIINLLQVFKGKTQDINAINALDDIMADMHSLDGKTVSEVKQLLNI